MDDKIFFLTEKRKEILKYIIAGGLTTLVNFVSFYILVYLIQLNLNIGNALAIMLSIIFAYFINSRFVFSSSAVNNKKWEEFIKFITSRGATMLVEVLGVFLLADILHITPIIAKGVMQIVVLVLNYMFSKIFVFK